MEKIIKLSDCKTLDELNSFVPCNPERVYYSDKGDVIGMGEIMFHVCNGKFVASKKACGYTYNEVFADEKDYKEYAKAQEIEKLEQEVIALRKELLEKDMKLMKLTGEENGKN